MSGLNNLSGCSRDIPNSFVKDPLIKKYSYILKTTTTLYQLIDDNDDDNVNIVQLIGLEPGLR